MIRASSVYFDRLCAGREQAQEGLPEGPRSELAEDGKAIHAALFDPKKAKQLSPSNLEIYEDMIRKRTEVVRSIFGEAFVRELFEEGLFVARNGKAIISGHPDYVAIGEVEGERAALVIDFKSGFLDVPPPESNEQLRTYAVAVAQLFSVMRVYVTIIPRFGKAKQPAMYDSQDLALALQDLASVVAATQPLDAPRIPSLDACRYCRACGTERCLESMRQIAHAARPVSLATIDGEGMAHRLELFSLAEKIMERERELYLARYRENPAAYPQLQLVAGKFRSKIADPTAAYNAVSELVNADEFASEACTVGVTALKDLLKSKLREKGIKGREADNQIAALLEPVITKNQDKPSLKPVKGSPQLENEFPKVEVPA